MKTSLKMIMRPFELHSRDFKIQRRGRQRERQKKTIGFISKTTTLHAHHTFLYFSLPVFARLRRRFYKQNNNFARASRFFVLFFASFCTTTTWTCLFSRFIEDINKQRRNFISLFELGNGPLEFNSMRNKNNERTQIHFLSDVLVAVESLDLKVPSMLPSIRPLEAKIQF